MSKSRGRDAADVVRIRIVGAPAVVEATAAHVQRIADVFSKSRLLPRDHEPGRVSCYLKARNVLSLDALGVEDPVETGESRHPLED